MNVPLATVASIVSLALGLVPLFRQFFENDETFKRRCDLIVDEIKGRVSDLLARLIADAVDRKMKHSNDLMREDGIHAEDLFKAFSVLLTRHSREVYRISRMLETYRTCNKVLFVGVILSMISFFISLVVSQFNSYLIVAISIVMAIQLSMVGTLVLLIYRSKEIEEHL